MKYTPTKNGIACIACITIVAIFAYTLAGREKNIPPEPLTEADASQQNVTIEQTASYDYVLKSYQGKLAVFLQSSSSASPEMVLNVYVHLLPEYDRVRLQTGIPVKDYATLVALIEDYTS